MKLMKKQLQKIIQEEIKKINESNSQYIIKVNYSGQWDKDDIKIYWPGLGGQSLRLSGMSDSTWLIKLAIRRNVDVIWLDKKIPKRIINRLKLAVDRVNTKGHSLELRESIVEAVSRSIILPSYNVEWEDETGIHRGYVNNIGADNATITRSQTNDKPNQGIVVVPIDKLTKIGEGNYIAELLNTFKKPFAVIDFTTNPKIAMVKSVHKTRTNAFKMVKSNERVIRLKSQVKSGYIIDKRAAERLIISEGRGRPKVGMIKPKLTPGARIKLWFSPAERKRALIFRKAHGDLGRIYDVTETPAGWFYTVRLFQGRIDDDEFLVDKFHMLTDKNVKLAK